MTRITLTLTTFLLLLIPISSAAQTKLAPEWMGGYTFGSSWTLLRMHITGSGSELSATIDVPSVDLVAQPVTNLRRQSSTIAFGVPQGAAQLSFEGHIGEDTIEGTVVSEERQGKVQLLRLAADRASHAQYQGAYEWTANHLVYIQFWDELGKDQLGIFDESGETRTLYAMGDDKFFVGSGVAYPVPLEARIAFHRNEWGAVTSLSWQSPGKVTRVAERVTPYSQQDITFRNGDVQLAGTLMLPNRVGKHPAMVLIHGSGPEDRNALLPFVRFVARHNIALLAYDKRGVGGSTGDWKEGGNRDYTLLILAEGNHVLMEARTGSTEEFPSLQRFLPEYFSTLLTWMSHRIHGFD